MSGLSNKRAAGDGGSGPPEKKMNREEKTTTTLIEPIRLGGISSTVGGLLRKSHLACAQSVWNLVCARVYIHKTGGEGGCANGVNVIREQLYGVPSGLLLMRTYVPVSPV